MTEAGRHSGTSRDAPRTGVTARSSDSRLDGNKTSREVVLLGLSKEFSGMLAADATNCGYRAHEIPADSNLVQVLTRVRPVLAVLNMDTPKALEQLAVCRHEMSTGPLVGITDVPCLVRASAAIHRGASLVLARPTTFHQIAAILEGQPQASAVPMSLDRAIWEYLNQTLAETGSISAAARRLQLDRSSFKRMLRKRRPEH